jgi:hypothetical protein
MSVMSSQGAPHVKAVWRVDKELNRRARLATTGRAAQ